jgi:16S rRNA (uracil1498-N3)-methyltransferase
MSLRVPLESLSAGERELSAEASRYLLKVRRLRTGDRCVAFDPAAALEADLEVLGTPRKRARVQLTKLRPARRVALRSVTVIQGLAKGTKVDAVVRDATELGATRIVVARCKRSVKQDVDLPRLERVALEAARQSLRGDVPLIEGPNAFGEAIKLLVGESVRILLTPEGDHAFADLALHDDVPVVIAIGPEGGFSDDERSVARAAGFSETRLGAFVLRTETACAAALGAVAAYSGK